MKSKLAVFVGAAVIFALIVMAIPVKLPASVSKWRHDMPDDGTMLCSAAGEGFLVNNDPFGFRVDRHQAFDQECKARMK